MFTALRISTWLAVGTCILGLVGCATSAGTGTDTNSATASPGQVSPGPEVTPGADTISALGGSIRYSDTQLLPQVLTSFGAATHDGWLYVLGGYFGTPHEYSRAKQSGVLYRTRIGDGHEWQRMAGIEPLQSVALVAHGDTLIRVGGMRALNEAGTDPVLVSVDEVARYRPATNTWEPLPALPEPRSSHDAVMLGDELYVIGGWRLAAESDWGDGHWYENGLVLDLAATTPTWREFPVPFQRRAIALAATEHHLMAVGGMEDGEHSSQVDIFDRQRGTWSRGPDYPANGFGAAGVAVAGRVYVSGMDGEVHSLAPGDERWRPTTTLMFPRYFHRLVRADDKAMLAVGGIKSSRVRIIERIPVAQENPAPRVYKWTLQAASPAKNRQGVFLHADRLYVFGGNNSLEQHDFEPENFVADGYALNLGLLEWSPIAPYPQRRQTMQTAPLPGGEQAISIGGFGHDGSRPRTHPESYVYHFENNTWTQRAGTLPISRSQFGLVGYQDKLWVFGGLDFDMNRPEKQQFRHMTAVLAASATDPAAGFDDTGVSLPRTRRAFGGALLGDRYYLVGGIREGFELVDTCDVYDFKDRSWHTMAAPRRTRISPELVALDGKLYLASGSVKDKDDNIVADRSIEVFDPASNSWSVLVEELPLDTAHMRMFAYRGRLLVYNAHDPSDSVHLLMIEP